MIFTWRHRILTFACRVWDFYLCRRDIYLFLGRCIVWNDAGLSSTVAARTPAHPPHIQSDASPYMHHMHMLSCPQRHLAACPGTEWHSGHAQFPDPSDRTGRYYRVKTVFRLTRQKVHVIQSTTSYSEIPGLT